MNTGKLARNLISTLNRQQQSLACNYSTIKKPPVPIPPLPDDRRPIHIFRPSLLQHQSGLNNKDSRPQSKHTIPTSGIANLLNKPPQTPTPTTTMPGLGLNAFGQTKSPLMGGMFSSKRPGHRSKTATTAAAAATIVRAFSSNGRLNPKTVHQVVVRQSVRYRKMFHDGTGLLKDNAEHPDKVPRAMIRDRREEDLDWVTDGEEEMKSSAAKKRKEEVRMAVEEVGERAEEVREVVLELERELPEVEELDVVQPAVVSSPVSGQGPMIEVREDIDDVPEPEVAAGAIEEPASAPVQEVQPEPEQPKVHEVQPKPQPEPEQIEVQEAQPEPAAATVQQVQPQSAPIEVQQSEPEPEQVKLQEPAAVQKPQETPVEPTAEVKPAASENSDPASISPEVTAPHHRPAIKTPAPVEAEEKKAAQKSDNIGRKEPASDSKKSKPSTVPAASAKTSTPIDDVVPSENPESSKSSVKDHEEHDNESDSSLPPAYSAVPPKIADNLKLPAGKINPQVQNTIEALKAERIATKTIQSKEMASPWMREGTDQSPVKELNAVKHSEHGINDEAVATVEKQDEAVEEEYLQGELEYPQYT